MMLAALAAQSKPLGRRPAGVERLARLAPGRVSKEVGPSHQEVVWPHCTSVVPRGDDGIADDVVEDHRLRKLGLG